MKGLLAIFLGFLLTLQPAWAGVAMAADHLWKQPGPLAQSLQPSPERGHDIDPASLLAQAGSDDNPEFDTMDDKEPGVADTALLIVLGLAAASAGIVIPLVLLK